MKLSSIAVKNFNPVTLNITLENINEFNLFLTLVGSNIRVPELLYPYDEEYQKRLSEMMTKMFSELTSYQKNLVGN